MNNCRRFVQESGNYLILVPCSGRSQTRFGRGTAEPVAALPEAESGPHSIPPATHYLLIAHGCNSGPNLLAKTRRLLQRRPRHPSVASQSPTGREIPLFPAPRTIAARDALSISGHTRVAPNDLKTPAGRPDNGSC